MLNNVYPFIVKREFFGAIIYFSLIFSIINYKCMFVITKCKEF
jgi:hypothetical protein